MRFRSTNLCWQCFFHFKAIQRHTSQDIGKKKGVLGDERVLLLAKVNKVWIALRNYKCKFGSYSAKQNLPIVFQKSVVPVDDLALPGVSITVTTL